MTAVKYAVYIVVIEDTDEADRGLLVSVDSGERAHGDMDIEDAQELAADLILVVPDRLPNIAPSISAVETASVRGVSGRVAYTVPDYGAWIR